jgi:two-component system response regulator GlrR
MASTAAHDSRLARLIGTSAPFREQVDRLARVAACDSRVLISGETGTGKELFAQATHYLSPRAPRPYVAVNCGAIPVELVESELFGHVRGAYTSALSSREGLVPEADGGTLFLDDVDCLPAPAQSKLLRFLQENEYRAVGSNTVRHSDVRVIAASNRNLLELAQRGSFRHDLYYRLNVLKLNLPSLRERREDIPLLAAHFARLFAQQHKRAASALTDAAVAKLTAHDWPGNVRELQHVVERAVLMAAGSRLDAGDMDIDAGERDGGAADAGAGHPTTAAEESFRAAKARMVAQFERGYIETLLSKASGNVTRAARAAQKNRRAFFALMRKYGIDAQQFRSGL